MTKVKPIVLELQGGLTVLVREAIADDAASLAELNVAADPLAPWTADRAARLIARSAADPQRLLLVALAAGNTIARLRFAAPARSGTRHRGRFGILVAPPFRGRGIGSTLIRQLLNWARAHPTIEKIGLGVLASNSAAIRLYENHGFVEEARRKGEFRLPDGGFVDDVWMALWVKRGSGMPVRTTNG